MTKVEKILFLFLALCLGVLCYNDPWDGQNMFPSFDKTNVTHEYILIIKREILEGHQKLQYTINHTVPGPIITIPLGDSVSITVHNEIENDGTTLHWHGMSLSHEGFNDGVIGFTQCIISNITGFNTFRYR